MPNINKYNTIPTPDSTNKSGDFGITKAGDMYVLSNTNEWVPMKGNILTNELIANWNEAYNLRHTHANKSALDMVSLATISNWDDAFAKAHTHSNKAVLDSITSANVTSWNNALRYISVIAQNVNLDTFTATGMYTQTNNAWASKALNYPIDTVGGILRVYNSFTTGITHIIQEYTTLSTNNAKYRRYLFSGTWSPWVKSLDDRDVTPAMIANWNTAFGWGNHATAGYITTATADARYLKLTGGDLTGDVNVLNGKKISFTATDGKVFDVTGTGLTHTSGANKFTLNFINSEAWGLSHGTQTMMHKDITNNILQVGSTANTGLLRLKSTNGLNPNRTVLTNTNGDVHFYQGLPLFKDYLVNNLITDTKNTINDGIELSYINSSTVDKPTNFSSGTMLSLNINTSGGSQIAFSTSTDPAVYFRQRALGVFGSWYRLATTNDLTALGNDYINKTANDLPANSTWYVKKDTSGIGVLDTNFIGLYDNDTKAYVTNKMLKITGGGINTDSQSILNGTVIFNQEATFNITSKYVESGISYTSGGVTTNTGMANGRLGVISGNSSKNGYFVVSGDNPITFAVTSGTAGIDSYAIGSHGTATNVISGYNGSLISYGNPATGTQSQLFGNTAGYFFFRSSNGTTFNNWKSMVGFEDLSLTADETSIKLTHNGITKTAPLLGNISQNTYQNSWLASFNGLGYIDYVLPKNMSGEIILTVTGYFGTQNQAGTLKILATVGASSTGIYNQSAQILAIRGFTGNFFGVDLTTPFIFVDGGPVLRLWSVNSGTLPANQCRVFMEIKTRTQSFTSINDVQPKPFVADTNIPDDQSVNGAPKSVTVNNLAFRDNGVIMKSLTANVSVSPANSNGLRITGVNNTASGYLYLGSGNNRLGVDVGTNGAPLLYNNSQVVTRDYAISNGFIFSEGNSTGTINGASSDLGLPANSFKPVKSGFYRANGENNWGSLSMVIAHPSQSNGGYMAGIAFDYSGTNAYLTGNDSAGVKLPNKKILTEGDVDLSQYWKIFTSGVNKGFQNTGAYYFFDAAGGSATQQIVAGGITISNVINDISKVPTNGIFTKGAIHTENVINRTSGPLTLQTAGITKFRGDTTNTIVSAISSAANNGVYIRPLGDTESNSQTVFGTNVIRHYTKQRHFENVPNISKAVNLNAIYFTTGPSVGNIKISFPSNMNAITWTMKVSVFSYTGVVNINNTYQLPMELTISGYSTNSTNLINIGASVINEFPNFKGIRIGNNADGTKAVMIDFNSATNNLKVVIDEIVTTQGGANATALDGDYPITLVTDDTGFTTLTTVLLENFKNYIDRTKIDGAFPTDINRPVTSTNATTDFSALPNGNYSSAVSANSTNLPYNLPGGLISFGGSNQTTRILGPRDGSDNIFFQSGAGSANWIQFASRNYVNTQLAGYIPTSQKGQPNGVATLDANGFVPSTQLPSYVDDVLEFPSLSAFPTVGESGKIYIAIDTNMQYRWSGTTYVPIMSSGGVISVNGKTGVVTLTKDDIGLGNVDNTADNVKNVLTATKWTTARNVTYTGDVTGTGSVDGSANVSFAMNLSNTGVTAGTYRSLTVDAKGRVSAGTNPTTLAGYGITDAMSTSHPANGITSTNINNWNTAFGWGNFRTFGLGSSGVANSLTDFNNWNTEVGTESRFFSTVAQNVTNGPTGINYATGISISRSAAVQSQLVFGGHTTANGLAYRNKIGTDTWGAWVYAWTDKHFSQTNINNWNTAFGWGNHATAGYLKQADLNGALAGYVNKAGDTMSDELVIRANGKPMTLSSVAKTQNYLAWLMYDNSKAIGYIGANGGSAVGDGGAGDKFVIRGTTGLDLYTDSGNVTVNGGGVWTTNHFENQDLQNFFSAYNDSIVSGNMTAIQLTLNKRSGGASINIPIPQFNQNTTGNAGSATKLQTGRVIKIGEQTNTFDGTSNLTFGHNEMKVTMCGVKTYGESWNSVVVLDTRNADPIPSTHLQQSVSFDFKQSSAIGLTSIAGVTDYASTMTSAPFVNDSGNNGSAYILAHSNGVMAFRDYYNGAWSTWKKFWTSKDFQQAHINNWNTAYTWGNHATAGYLKQADLNGALAGYVKKSGDTMTGFLTSPGITIVAPGTNSYAFLTSENLGNEAGLTGGDDDIIAARDYGANKYVFANDSIQAFLWGNTPGGSGPGNVGIRSTPHATYQFYINGETGSNGSFTAVGFYESSRRELKTNIKPFEKSGLDLVNELDIVTFDRIDNESIKDKIGIIIDDTPAEFASGSGNEVDLYKTTFIQAKAIQELSETVEKQSKEIEELKEMVKLLLSK